jgi:hypothetical protein
MRKGEVMGMVKIMITLKRELKLLVIKWKTKKQNGEEITGYYILETVPGDTLDEENIITMRFLGDNKDPLSAS